MDIYTRTSYSIKPQNSKHTNWLTAHLAVRITKEGIEPFVYDTITQFQQKCLADIYNNNGLPHGTVCSSCCTENVVVCPTNRICKVRRGTCSYHKSVAKQYLPAGCPYHICHNLRDDIYIAHCYYGPSFKNTDATQWCTNPWEVAKCFMPPDGYKDVTSPAETDFIGLINIMLTCKDFQSKISDDLVRKSNIGKCRNIYRHIRHSPSLEVEEADLQQYFTDLQNLLSDTKELAGNKDAQNARRKLSQLQNDRQVTEESISQEEVNLTTSDSQAEDKKHSQLDKVMLPREILNMDRRAIELYIKALSEGEIKVRNIRLMIVGNYGAGKTTLAKRLFRERVDITERKSTDGIYVHVGRRKVSLKNKTWMDTDGQRKAIVDRVATLIHNTNEEHQQLLPTLTQNTNEEDQQLSPISNWDDSGLDDPKKERKFHLESPDINEPPKTGVPPTLAPNLSATENSPENSINEENDSKNDDFLRHKNHFQEFVKEVKNDGFINDEMHCDLSLWDFAGQRIVHATHQAFLSRRAVYLLVFDMSKEITDVVEDDIWHYDCKGEQKCKISESIEYWLNSIHEFCSCQEEPEPPVILVGTFVDKLEKNSDHAEKTFYNLRSALLEKVANCHLQDKHFQVDNSLDDNEITEKLRQYIVQVASEQSHWGESIPARWITLEERLIRLKEELNVKVIDMETLIEVNRQLPVPIKNQEEIDLFLKFHHETGTILYFGDDDIKNDILLQPQWLIDAFKSLITAAMFCIQKRNIQKKWHEFYRSAILKQDLIVLIWQEEKNSSYLAHKDLILRFMEKLGFLAKPKTQAEDFYLVPCMLKEPPPAKIITCKDLQQCKSTSKLCLTNHIELDKRFIPTTAFNKLLAACIKQWPLAMERNKYMIFCGGAEFQLEDNHFLYIFLYEHVIQIWISRKSKAGHNPNTMVCREVKDIILTMLKENVRMQREMLSFVKCPWYNLYSNENMVLLQEDIQDSEIPCYCQQPDEHVVSLMELANCWLSEETVQALHIDLEKKPTEKDISRMSLRIGTEFKQLAFQLGISKPELEQIEMDQNTTADKITAVLSMWAKHMHDQATYGNLIKAMQDSGVDIAYVFKK